MHLVVEIFGWVVITVGTLVFLFLLGVYVYLEVWDERLKEHWYRPAVCMNCRQYKGKGDDLVPHCKDCIDRVQRKLGEKW